MIAQLTRPVSDAVIPDLNSARSLCSSPSGLAHKIHLLSIAMSRQPAKRQRANTNGDLTATSTPTNAKCDDYKSIIDTFDEQTLRAVLLAAAQSIPDVAALIVNRRDDILREESTKVIDFDFQSKVAWHALNNPRDSRNGSRGYDAGMDAGVCVSQTIAKIREQTPAHASFGTKKSALVTLRKIGKSIALGGRYDEFSSEVISTLNNEGGPLEKAMVDIVDAMKEEEKAKMRDNKEWIEKVKELVELGKDVDMFETLEKMLEVLGPAKPRTSDSRTVGSTIEDLDGRESAKSVQRGAR